MPVALVAPNLTAVAPVRFSPVIVTVVPPVPGPSAGLTFVTAGHGVAPGAIRTPIWGATIATPEAEKAFEKRISLVTPLGRLGETEHVSKTVLFLASDDAAHVQGQELFVDGGATASPSGAPIYRG